MAQKEKDLLFQDLSSRLPYLVKVFKRGNEKISGYLVGIVDNRATISSNSQAIFEVNDIVPYLFPLSSITEEQLGELIELVWPDTSYDIYLDLDEPEVDINIGNRTESYLVSEVQFWGIKAVSWLYKNHFDINDLIPLGLAKDATGLNIY